MMSSGMSDQFDDRTTALYPLTVYYEGDDVLTRDMSCKHLRDIQTILDDRMKPLWLLLLLLILLGLRLFGAPGSFCGGWLG